MSLPPTRVIIFSALMILTLALCAVAVVSGQITPETIGQMVRRAGSWGMAAYVVGVVVMELIWLPRAWGLLVGGMLFGPWLGTGLSIVGDLAGGLLCYALARTTARRWVEQVLERHPRASRVTRLLAHRRGTSTMAFLRVLPVAHYTLVSYAAGITGVRPVPYMVGTGVGILPASVLYPLLGHAALAPGSPLFLATLGIISLFLVVTILTARRVLKEPKDDLDEARDTTEKR